MFCIKCGMRLNDTATVCHACGTKTVFPEGFNPEAKSAPAETVIAEPPPVPDDFDISKAKISYNGKTMLITDIPEFDPDKTATGPEYFPPAYAASDAAENKPLFNGDNVSHASSQKKNSKLPAVIIAAVVVILAVAAVLFVLKNNEGNGNTDPKNSNYSVTTENVDADQSTAAMSPAHSAPVY